MATRRMNLLRTKIRNHQRAKAFRAFAPTHMHYAAMVVQGSLREFGEACVVVGLDISYWVPAEQ